MGLVAWVEDGDAAGSVLGLCDRFGGDWAWGGWIPRSSEKPPCLGKTTINIFLSFFFTLNIILYFINILALIFFLSIYFYDIVFLNGGPLEKQPLLKGHPPYMIENENDMK